MKVGLSTLALVVGFVASVSCVQAKDAVAGEKAAKSEPAKAAASVQEPAPAADANFFPGGGWDGNNLRVSVSHSKLLKVSAQ